MNTSRRLFTLASLAFSLVAVAGCGPSVGSGGSGGAPDAHAEPPAPGPAVPPDGKGHVTFAIDTILLGDRDPDGASDPESAWKQYGFDLDGKITGAGRPDGLAGLCTPLSGASVAGAHTDGDAGIDNAFGRSLLPLILGADPSFPREVAGSLAAGGATLLIDLDALGAGADYTGLTARLYTGAPLAKAPVYDGSDVWPVGPGSLLDPADVASAALRAPDAYLVGDTWVGRFHGVLTIELPWLGQQTMRLHIGDPVISMALDPSRDGATHGTLAGILATADLLAEAEDQALRLDPTLCAGTTTVDAILAQLGQASDILVDGTQDPALPCDGISIGLGFTAKRVTLGPVAAPAAPLPKVTCAPSVG